MNRPGQPPGESSRHAFVDAELTGAEKRDIEHRALSDPDLRATLGDLSALKGLVRGAYEHARPCEVRAPPRRTRVLRPAALAAACLVAGWLAQAEFTRLTDPARSAATGPGATGAAVATHSDRILLHVSSGDPEHLHALLDNARALLAHAARESRPLRVEIVANQAGVDLFRAGVSPAASELAALRARHPALSLVACNQSLDRLRERGESVTLLPGVAVASSALDQIVARMRDGWLYLRG